LEGLVRKYGASEGSRHKICWTALTPFLLPLYTVTIWLEFLAGFAPQYLAPLSALTVILSFPFLLPLSHRDGLRSFLFKSEEVLLRLTGFPGLAVSIFPLIFSIFPASGLLDSRLFFYFFCWVQPSREPSTVASPPFPSLRMSFLDGTGAAGIDMTADFRVFAAALSCE